MQENGEDEMMNVISGRRCSALLTKSGPLGSLVRTLLESPLWWKEGYFLTWEAVPLYSRRVTTFNDTDSSNPLPSNESAEILNVQDIPSSRCLFRLRLSAHPTDGTESSSLPMLQTPTAVMPCQTPEQMRGRAEKNGYKNGTKYVSLEAQIRYDPKCSPLLPTPTAVEYKSEWTPEQKEKCLQRRAKEGKTAFPSKFNALKQMAFEGLLPTHTAIEGEKYTNTYNPNSQMGQSLSAMAGSGMLPTPSARDYKGKTNPGQVKEKSGCVYGETLPDAIGRMTKDCSPETAGQSSRLSPLFTEEMMGFPSMWTVLPFLSPDGELNH